MAREIDLLRHAVRNGYRVVEKDTGVCWDPETLQEEAAPHLQGEDRVAAPDGQVAVSGPYPGCLQRTGAWGLEDYALVGQTLHFLLFTALPAGAAGGPA